MDGYRRGADVERNQRRPTVSSPYRRILPVIWALGGVLFVGVLPFGWSAGIAVVLVLHMFFGGLVFADIQSLRRQGLDWGLTRHLWFGAAFIIPFIALLYYVYSGRRVTAENERRNAGSDDRVGATESVDASDRGESTDRTGTR